jgi:ribosomal protein S6
MKRLYELVLVLRDSLSEADKKKLLDTVKKWLGEVKIAKEEEIGKKVLSYPIKKETSGFYLKFSLETEATIPLDFEKRILSEDKILRHLLLRTK